MQPTGAEKRNWPFIENVIAPITDWWRKQSVVRGNVADINTMGPEEFSRMAQDVGISASDLRQLAAQCTDAADLLERRLASLGLDAAALAQTAPAQLRDMERLCSMCGAKGRCAHDLDVASADPAWRDYCPNADTLSSLAEDRQR